MKQDQSKYHYNFPSISPSVQTLLSKTSALKKISKARVDWLSKCRPLPVPTAVATFETFFKSSPVDIFTIIASVSMTLLKNFFFRACYGRRTRGELGKYGRRITFYHSHSLANAFTHGPG